MPPMTRLEVLAVGDKWNVNEYGIGRLSSHATKSAAADKARAVAAKNTPAQLIIRTMDGAIESERTYPYHPAVK